MDFKGGNEEIQLKMSFPLKRLLTGIMGRIPMT